MDALALRNKMVDEQVIARGIKDKRVLEAMRLIPRHLFVPQENQDVAYDDRPIPIGEGQTISQPYMVAFMTESLCLTKDDAILEVGTGSGYQSAVLAHCAKEVYTIERIEKLSRQAQKILTALKYTNIHFYIGDGTEGIKEAALRFDAIMITAATPHPMDNFIGILKDKGRMVVPVGSREVQELTLILKEGSSIKRSQICKCVFVPLIGKYGFN